MLSSLYGSLILRPAADLAQPAANLTPTRLTRGAAETAWINYTAFACTATRLVITTVGNATVVITILAQTERFIDNVGAIRLDSVALNLSPRGGKQTHD